MKHPRFLIIVMLAAALAMLIGSGKGRALAYPEPAIVASSWSLAFTLAEPATIAVPDVHGSTRWYWYVAYQVANHSGDDRRFIPEFTIATDRGHIISAGRKVPGAVFRAIKAELKNPLLESPTQIVGKILQGEDFAKEGVAIWPVPDQDVDEFSLFVSGLSGETATIRNPLTGDEVLMRRTLMLTYATPGNNPNPQDQSVILTARREVMR